MPRLALFCECRQWFYRLAGQLNKWYLAKTMGFFHVRYHCKSMWNGNEYNITNQYQRCIVSKRITTFSPSIFSWTIYSSFGGDLSMCFLFSPPEKINWELWKLRLSLPGGGSCKDGHITIGRHFHNTYTQSKAKFHTFISTLFFTT